MAKPETPVILENDFERMIPEYHKGYTAYGEHIARYEVIAPLLAGKVVMDIASGSGYGTKILAETAERVYGVDVFKPAVEYAKQNYGADNIIYKVGDGVKIPLEDDMVDVVVSLETIEHIEDYEQFMREVKRVLKPDGLLVLSTPNDKEFVEDNHHHIHEFMHDELATLVRAYFSEMKPFYQATWIGNIIGEKHHLTKTWDQSLRFIQANPIKLDKALYFFFLCSNRPITESLEPLGVISEHYSDRQLQKKRLLTDKHVANLQEIIDADKAYVATQAKEIETLQQQVADGQIEAERAQKELHEIKNSKAWRYAKRLRNVKNCLTQ